MIPTTVDRDPLPTDNPRHAVWINDEKGLRRVTAANPGEAQIVVGAVLYEHTYELTKDGPWVYTKVPHVDL